VRVREAFSRLLDRRAIVALPRGGHGRFPPHFMPSPEVNGQWGLPDAEMARFPGFTEPFSAEVAKAKDLLREAGVDLKSLQLTFQSLISPNVDPYHVAAHSLLLNASGADIKLKQDSTTVLPQALAAKGWDISMTSGGTSYDDPSAIFLEYILTTGSRNRAKLNYGIDALAAQQDAELDAKKRRDIVYEIQRKLIREATLVPVVYQVDGWTTHAHMKGWRAPFLSVGPQNRMERVWLDR
jgi:peptide/nickel transport system substrate-binding protein